MVSKEELEKLKNISEEYVSNIPGLVFDHFGIKVAGAVKYEDMKKSLEKVYGEVSFKGRRILSGQLDGRILEILEPMSDEIISESFVDHVAYVTDSPEDLKKKIGQPVISSFDVGSTHGFKIKTVQGLIIEFRNNHLLDSIQDFR